MDQFLAILETQNFGLESNSNLLKSKYRTSKIAKNDIFGPFEFAKIQISESLKLPKMTFSDRLNLPKKSSNFTF